MTADSLYARLRRRPFVPFRMYLSGGTTYDVAHPELMLISKSGITLALYDPGQSSDDVPARDVLISYLHVTSTDDLPIPKRAAG